MSSEKKFWTKPEVTAFTSAKDAIAYYAERGMLEHAEAVKKLRSQADGELLQREQDKDKAQVIQRRKASGR